jgi:plasmid maintenance system antidote protein VapI
MIKNRMCPIHPGETRREEYMAPLWLPANALARTKIRTLGLAKEVAEPAIRWARRHQGNEQV